MRAFLSSNRKHILRRRALRAALESLERREMLAADPSLLLDLNTQPSPGDINSLFGDVREFGSIGFFEHDTLSTGRELWRTDGTPEGTFLLQDTSPGSARSYVGDIVEFNDEYYFGLQSELESIGGLYRTDGTSAGTA